MTTKKLTLIALLGMLAVALVPAFAESLLANGEITLPASTSATVVTNDVGLYDSVAKKEWSAVKAVIVQNNSDFATTTTVKRIDLDDSTTLVTASAASNATTYAAVTLYGSITNAVKVYSGTNDAAVFTNSIISYYPIPAPCAKDVRLTVAYPTNDAEATLEFFIYGE